MTFVTAAPMLDPVCPERGRDARMQTVMLQFAIAAHRTLDAQRPKGRSATLSSVKTPKPLIQMSTFHNASSIKLK